MSKLKIGDAAYVSIASPELKGQKVTIVSGPIGTGERAYRQVEDAKGKLYAIEIRLLRESGKKAPAKKKAAPAKRVTTTKAKPKAKARTKAASKPKTKDVKTACLPLFDEDFKKFENQAYEELKKARMKDVKAGKVTLRELQSSAYKTAYKQYYGK